MAGDENILARIAARTRERVAEEAAAVPLAEMARRARDLAAAELAASADGAFAFPFERVLAADGMSFICEVKRASPSKGLISPDFDPVAIAREYEAAGASAISCLTEPFWFQGSDEYLTQVSQAVGIPVLRKDFVVDEYMVYQAKTIGASAVLLICSILTDEQLRDYVALAHELGMSALVEAYEAEEVPRAIAAGARVVGVNNRDLRTFEVDFGRSIDLRPEVGDGRLFVSESGVETRTDVARLEAARVDAVLIGETLMRSGDKRAMIRDLRGDAEGEPSADAAAPALPRVKLCGMFRDEDIDAVLASAPDMCGFIVDYPRSHRSVSPERLRELSGRLAGSGVTRVGVFVDADPHLIEGLVADGTLDAVQLHGHEGEDYVRALASRLAGRAAVIQAFRVRGAEDVARAESSPADLVLLDGGRGEGKAFDWSLVRSVRRDFLLAGGLGPDNVAEAIRAVRPWGVDMSSDIETDKRKDPEKMAAAVAAVRGADR